MLDFRAPQGSRGGFRATRGTPDPLGVLFQAPVPVPAGYGVPPAPQFVPNSPEYWSSSATASSGGESGSERSPSPPPSGPLPGMGSEWELLSELLLDEALTTTGLAAPTPVPVPDPTLGDWRQPQTSWSPPPAAVAPSAADISPTLRPRGSNVPVKAVSPPSPAVKSEEDSASSSSPGLSAEEVKKRRRRSQIASSVQRHREKKKGVVTGLKLELAELSSELERLREARKARDPAHARLVDSEEAAVTQRRKRRQAEELNDRMKKALFQQTAFIFGMRGLLDGSGGSMPIPGELHFHDWIHSYTVLSAPKDAAARHKEYIAHFSESKLDLAQKLVARETDCVMPRLSRAAPYFARTRVLHDGTRQFEDERDFSTARALRGTEDAGDGRVVKKFLSVFLFDERLCGPPERLHALAFESSKDVGVYWPAAGYAARTLDRAESPSGGSVTYADMAADMGVIDGRSRADSDGSESDDDLRVEARVLCREQQSDIDGSGVIVWDYVDRDELSTAAGSSSAPPEIRRECCGAVTVQREAGGLVSMRSVSVKVFSPAGGAGTEADGNEEQRAEVGRRLGLLATEAERQQEKCTRFVYEAICERLAAL